MKKKFGVYLETTLIASFKEFLSQKYGKNHHGDLSFEVSQALQSWISTHTDTQTKLKYQSPNPLPNVFTVKEQVKAYLREHMNYEQVYTVPKKHVEIAIASLRGTDPRTVKKWIQLFVKWKCIRWINSNVVEFI